MAKKNNEEIKITVLTPTYNRAKKLVKLYDSLIEQSDKCFKWVIIDDGSNDNTRELVEKFNIAQVDITYFYKNNGGKHTAINYGMQYIDTEYTFIVDSDDYLLSNAIELANIWIDDIEGLSDFAGVSGVRVTGERTIVGQYPSNYNYIDCLNSERKKKKLTGDKAEIYKSCLLKEYPFPEYEAEKFLPESVIWNRFSILGLKLRWHKEGLIVCEYLEDGLTAAMKDINHFADNINGYRADCVISVSAMPFPYDYSAGSVYYARCKAIGQEKDCIKCLRISKMKEIVIKVLGSIRYYLGRY